MSRRTTPERISIRRRTHSSSSPEREIRTSEESNEELDEEEILRHLPVKNIDHCENDNPSGSTLLYLGMLGLLALTVCSMCMMNKEQEAPPLKKTTIQQLQSKYNTQDEELWLYIQSGLKEVISMHRPRTFIFLYTDESSITLHKLLVELGEYVTCHLTSCEQTPLFLNYIDLNNKDYLMDHGKLITNYKPILSRKGVMIVRNIERVEAEPAKAFHVFCDEFTPLVERSMVIFTMRVDEFHGDDNLQYLEDYFRKKWEDMDRDMFYALFTRIASVIVQIRK